MAEAMTDLAAGYLAFCGVKLVGYTAAAAIISRVYGRRDRNAFQVGPVRTLIGIAASAVLISVVWTLDALVVKPAIVIGVFCGGLVAMRFAEWWILIWLFYDRQLSSLRRDWIVAFLGVVWSFALDIPALHGTYVAGRMIVC